MAPMNNLTLHHVGTAVYKLDEAKPFYENLGYVADENIYDPLQNVEVCVLRKDGRPTIELLAPHNDKSPVNGVLAKSGAGPYHVCYAVENIDIAVQKLKKDRFILVSRPKVSNAFGGMMVCFMFRKDIGLIELIEEK